jgi:membrane protein
MRRHGARSNVFQPSRRRFRSRAIGVIMGRSMRAWDEDDVPRLAAALVFYALLSFAPMLVIVVGVASLFFGNAAARGQLAWDFHNIVGWDGARIIQSMVESTRSHHSGILATGLSVIALVFGASSVVVELRSDLNTIWHVLPREGMSSLKALAGMCKDRFVSFLLIVAAGFLLLLSLVASAAIAAANRILGPNLPVPEAWLHVLTFVISFLVITFLFGAIYKVMPDVSLQWRDVAVGASVTSLIFTIGKQLIALYLGKAALGSTYGAAGSLVVLLVWLYYSAQLFFLGAEFTKVYAATYGSRPKQAPAAGPADAPAETEGRS